jgi:energy-coupling factor transporter ATP-binding protein EcfA2
VVREGNATVFFGPSGSGKTTITRLSTGDLILNDDCILITRDGTGFLASGVPFKGAEDIGAADAGAFPIAGLFRLVQADTVSCERLEAPRAVGEITGSIPFVTETTEGFEMVFPVLNELVRAVPVFRLHFRLADDFWPAVENAVHT